MWENHCTASLVYPEHVIEQLSLHKEWLLKALTESHLTVSTLHNEGFFFLKVINVSLFPVYILNQVKLSYNRVIFSMYVILILSI